MLNNLFKDPEFLMNVFDNMRDGLMIMDTDGNILFFNKAASSITGYNNDEVIGKPCTILDTDSCSILTKDGKQRRCDIFKNGTMTNKRCRIKSKDGKAVHLLKNAVVLKDKKGIAISAVESITDVTSLYMKELELEELKRGLREEYWFQGLLGKTSPMKILYEQIRNAATSEASVMIYGESGTGKNLVANAIHRLSRRKQGPFVEMNCAALNESLLESELFGHKKGSFTGAIQDRIGRIEAANNGSLFLDEIGDMPNSMQAKLLRVIEEKVIERVGENKEIHVDVRFISATNHDLEKLVLDKTFREDLFYRVNSVLIKVPSLRQRFQDIPLLAFHYLKKISSINNKKITTISAPAMELIKTFDWPGNVRQLINTIEHSTITCKGNSIEVSDLPDYIFQKKKNRDRK